MLLLVKILPVAICCPSRNSVAARNVATRPAWVLELMHNYQYLRKAKLPRRGV